VDDEHGSGHAGKPVVPGGVAGEAGVEVLALAECGADGDDRLID